MEKVEKNVIDEIVEKIEQLSALELSDLAKQLEDKFGVAGMMAPVGMAAAAGQPAAGGEEKKEEKTLFDVVLKTFGSNKIQAIKEVRAMTNLGLKEAKDLIEALPKPIKEKVSKEEAAEIKAKMEAIGAEVEVK
jgi:large subunit ribosomal protein L7/L12